MNGIANGKLNSTAPTQTGMRIVIDTTVTFTLAKGTITVDALDLNDFIDSVWETKTVTKSGPDGEPLPQKDEHGEIIHDAAGKPVPAKFLIPYYETIEAAITEFLEGKTEIQLSRSEKRAIWEESQGIWEKKRASLRASAPDSPTSPRFTTPESSDLDD